MGGGQSGVSYSDCPDNFRGEMGGQGGAEFAALLLSGGNRGNAGGDDEIGTAAELV